MSTTTTERSQAVWLGDIVTIGAGKTRWTVTRARRDMLNLTSPRGAVRLVMRDRAQLVERCPDGPQLEMWTDGRGYLGGELVYASDNMISSVVRWKNQGEDGEESAYSVSVAVCKNRELEILTEGGYRGSAYLRRGEVVDLATTLLAMARHIVE